MPLKVLLSPEGVGLALIILLLLYVNFVNNSCKVSTVNFERIKKLKSKITDNNGKGFLFIGLVLLILGVIIYKAIVINNSPREDMKGISTVINFAVIYYIYFLYLLSRSVKNIDKLNLHYLDGRSFYNNESGYLDYKGLKYLDNIDYKGYLLRELNLRRRILFINILMFLYLIILFIDTNSSISIRNLLFGYEIPLYYSIIFDFTILYIFNIFFKLQESNIIKLYKNRVGLNMDGDAIK